MPEPTRPLRPLLPLPDGGWQAMSVATPVDFKIRGLALVPPRSTVPVIVVPGIMGTNLRAKSKPRSREEENEEVNPGKPAWRPPNTTPGGLWDALVWDQYDPAYRQRLLDPDTLEVDDSGEPHIRHDQWGPHVHPQLARERWWGELHAGSYIDLLCMLETRLNQTFYRRYAEDMRRIRPHWQEVMDCDPAKWGFPHMAPLTEAELERHALHHYPVYGAGYHWLRSAQEASQRLEQRIDDIIDYWKAHKRKCEQVILVTHSMGGLVARACARRIPDKIAGVIHGAMPALGAPAAYRRMACGTEVNDFVGRFAAMILGATTYDTTPVLATSPGPLELLPNHLYPGPWLHVSVRQPSGSQSVPDAVLDCLHLPNETKPDPYKIYRDLTSWYRLVDPALADPAGKYKPENKNGTVEAAIEKAIDTAERFHKEHLGDYYHPNTYAFYGADPDRRAFGQVRWVGRKPSESRTVLTPSNVKEGSFIRHYPDGRLVGVEPGCEMLFRPEPPDTRGDGTVPHQSGAGPAGNIRQLFETRGYDHQGSYRSEDMLMLTLRLIVRIVQGISQ